jgi:hypothetical protein
MAQSNEISQRQFTRVDEIIVKATATGPGEYVAIKALCPDMSAKSVTWKTADASVKAQERVTAKEIDEAVTASKPLRSFYDQVREVVMAKVPGQTYPAAVALKTPTDLLNYSEDVEDVLDERQSETWAKGLFDKMVVLLDAAVKEQNEASAAMQTLQKLQAARRLAAVEARPTFVQFRRVVRATFGRSSREYRSLLDRHGIAPEDDVVPAPPGAPTTPTTP